LQARHEVPNRRCGYVGVGNTDQVASRQFIGLNLTDPVSGVIDIAREKEVPDIGAYAGQLYCCDGKANSK